MKIHFVISLICFCFLLPVPSKAQLVSISGVVKNASTGEVKRNATVFESVSGIGTITNSQGYYRLLLTPGRHKLEISSAGFQKYSSAFKLMADTVISVELVPYELTQEKAVTEKELKIESFNSKGAGKATGIPAN